MVNGYAEIYKDNRRKHLRTHTMSKHIKCQIEEVSSPGVKTISHIYAVDRTGTVHTGCQTEDYGFQNSEQ